MLVRCAVCGADNDVTPAINPPATGPPDFDTRPGEPLRSTMRQWVYQCSNCGYASDDISTALSLATDVVRSDGYQQALVAPGLPSAALPLYCYSLILERSRQPADSGWAALHAAWACDDAGAIDGADKCRARAIQMWKRGKELGEAFGDDLASEFALVTDVYRRLGEFEHAIVGVL